MNTLDKEEFKKLIELGPLVSIDLIIYNELNEVLLGKRTNKPAQGYWFVPGGRLFKNETIEVGYERIIRTELPDSVRIINSKFLGVYQHLYDDNFSDNASFGTHYVVLAHELKLSNSCDMTPGDNQHKEFKWLSIEELINMADVHPYTKNYFIIPRKKCVNEGIISYHSPIFS